MSRDALVVGINTYEFTRLSKLTAPSEDAEAIAQLLTQYGEFKVRRLPVAKRGGQICVSRQNPVTLNQLKEALVQLFKPEGENIPETALLFFSGHGLREDRGIREGFLATSDVNPDLGFYGLSLQWLRRLLQESPIQQQIIWLDCCYSGELLNFTEADPGDRGTGRDRCFIAASRAFQTAAVDVSSEYSVFTKALLQGLDPKQHSDGLVSNYTLIDFLNQALKSITQSFVYANSGDQIILTGKGAKSVHPMQGICPYKALDYFDCNDDDPKYFYGRTALTDKLLEKVRSGNFLAVLGASGSGKSSVVRAGLLHQLKLGQRLSDSDEWHIYILRPGEHPLQRLAEAFVQPGLSAVERASQLAKAEELIGAGAVGLGHLVTAVEAPRVVLVVDQFEEVFTLCRDSAQRQQFFECLLGAVPRTDNKLCLVLVMRADFFGKCAEQEYGGLASLIQEHLVTVTPMTPEQLEEAITEPAKKVGLEVERSLVAEMIADVDGSPGCLPLLQYTLTVLWQQRIVERLTLSSYVGMGGVKGTLQKRADEVYQSLSPQEQQTAKRIFLELTQLGEGTEDTRRQVRKQDLVTAQQPEALVDRVIQRLADAKLVVTSTLIEKGSESGKVAVVDVAHEALIRHWSKLRMWVYENREALRKKRNIEEDAQEWLDKEKSSDYLLRGAKLAEAESFLQRYADSVLLSRLAQEFVLKSQQECDRLLQEEEERQQRELDQLRQLLAEEEKARQADRKARKAAQRMLVAISLSALIIFSAIGISLSWNWWRQQQHEQALYDAWSGIYTLQPTKNSIDFFTETLNKAHEHKNAADRHKTSRNVEQDVQRAIAYYRQIRVASLKELGEIENSPKSPTLFKNIENISEQAEDSQAQMISQYRLHLLDEALKNDGFGRWKDSSVVLEDGENRYTAGALQATYKILMHDVGAGADLNKNGQLDNNLEAKLIPCKTIKEIQFWWLKTTKEPCGWFAPNSDEFQSPNCKKLNGTTLTASLFETYTPSASFAIERINYCHKALKR